MGHFLRFGMMPDGGDMSPTIKQLGIKSPLEDAIGRVNLSFSYSKRIGEKDYTVWFSPEAPTNENASLLEVRWEVQDAFPQSILTGSFGNIMSEFFRDVVLKGVYSTWFDQIKCSTLR